MSGKTVIAGIAIAVLPTAPATADLSGAVTLASEYIYRGQAVSDHDPAVSIGIDYEHESGFFGGIWASSIDLANRFGSRDTELDYYLGYRFEPASPVAVSVSAVRYTYPGQQGAFDYAHVEGILSATFYDRYSVEFAYTDDLYGMGRPARHWGIRGDWPAASYWIVSGGLGLADLTAINTDRYTYWDLGLSTRWSSITLDVRWHDNEPIGGVLGEWSAGARIVLSLSYGL